MATGVTLGSTYLEAAQRSLLTHGDRTAMTFLPDGDLERRDSFTFGELEETARTIAADLQAAGVGAGDRVMLLQLPGRHMVAGFLGCVYANAIAVPAYPPNPFLGERGNERLAGIRRDAGATAVLTTSELLPLVQFSDDESRGLAWVLTDKPSASAEDYSSVEASPEDVAFLQYTSGSTSAPRGVRVTHRALMANVEMIVESSDFTDATVVCSWLPPFHDMGLISANLTPVVTGAHAVQMPPYEFLRRPERWLRAITHFRATYCWAPNFAYDLCVRRVKNLEELDLSSMRTMGSGAEPVRHKTMTAFRDKFVACGLKPEVLWVGYGLAEATLYVTVNRRGPVSTIHIDPDQLAEGRLALTSAELGRPLVSCGLPAPGSHVRICDPETDEPVEDGVVGEIRVSGAHVCDGYWGNPELSAEVFAEGELHTGDLGALWEGELFVTGRIKDLLIVRGRNHYPQDLEQTMESADANLRPGCGVAVAVPSETGELLVLIQELRAESTEDPEVIVEKILRQVAEQHGITADAIVLVEPRTIPKTTSGKLRRSAAAAAFQAGTLKAVHEWSAAARG